MEAAKRIQHYIVCDKGITSDEKTQYGGVCVGNAVAIG
jgi:hypothetical protein